MTERPPRAPRPAPSPERRIESERREERSDTLAEGSERRTELLAGMPPGPGRERALRGELAVTRRIWERETQERLRDDERNPDRPGLHSQLQAAAGEARGLPGAVGRVLGPQLERLARDMTPDPSNRNFYPPRLLNDIELCSRTVTQALEVYPNDPLLHRIRNLLVMSTAAIGPRRGYYARVDTPMRMSPWKLEQKRQTGTILQGLAVLALAPTALALLGSAAFAKPEEREQRIFSAFKVVAALFGAGLAHKLFTLHPDGSLRLTTGMDTLREQTAAFRNADPQSEYNRLRAIPAYKLSDTTLSSEWAELFERMNATGLPPPVAKLLRQRNALKPDEQKLVLNTFTPEGSRLRPALEAMMKSGPRTDEGKKGEDFRVFVGLFRAGRSQDAKRYIQNLLRGGPDALVGIPTDGPRTDSPAPRRPEGRAPGSPSSVTPPRASSTP